MIKLFPPNKLKTNPAFLSKFLAYGLCGLLIASIGTYFRLYPLIYRPSSLVNEKATVLVISRLKATVINQINAKFPHLSSFEKSRLVKQSFDRLLREEKEKVRSSIARLSREIATKSQDPQPAPYLLEADPYYYYELTENILRTGKISDTVKGSKYLNKFMLAPQGHWEPYNIHPYLGFSLYRLLAIFDPKITLMYAVSFTPLVVAALSLLPFLAICRLLGCGLGASLISAIFFILSPVFINRSAFGWYDNDPYNIFFPLAAFLCLFLGLNDNISRAKKLSLGFLCAFLIAAYSLFWQGWVYLLSIILIASIAIGVFNLFLLKKNAGAKNLGWYLGIINLGAFLGVSVIFGAKDFFVLFEEGWRALKNFMTPQLTLWPDVFIGVGELRKSSPADLVQLEGGWIFVAIALFGLLVFIIKSLRQKEPAPFLKGITIFLWCASSFVITLKAQRFALLLLVPLSLLFALGLSYLYVLIKEIAKRVLSRLPRLQKISFYATISIVSAGLIAISLRHAHETALSLQPIFNETWDKALSKIKNDTPKESIVNSWWPPGHFISAIAQRRVTFDGATSNNPQAYWMSNVFLTPDERRALGLMRMLNNSANQATEYLQECGIKLSQAVDILNRITRLDRNDAQKTLKTILDKDQIEGLLALTHRDPPPSYVLVYNDLVEKNLELSFIGGWDFSKIEKINSSKEMLASVPRRDSPQYIQFLWGLAGGPLHYSETLAQINKTDDRILFDQDISVNLKDMTCRLSSQKFGIGVPRSIVYDNGNDVIEKEFAHADLPFSVVLFKQDNLYNCIIADPRLARSLLFRLYFLKGKGLKYLEPFAQESDLTGRTRIYVYRVLWEDFLRDIKQP
ncbi:MAG TPA: STT3 domain-containing protein [Candidatus Omnitrophota bacterium]|nr:STT3 domain-containing protein [Candidatus Omnitrophota bacterium]HPD85151.1 STT3 domain-containing protein [Candidatus Omnitrophota bacterium]HRZ04348.1 STT3 domain-containing protein [Candidatus Omnitrophota bacterium]